MDSLVHRITAFIRRFAPAIIAVTILWTIGAALALQGLRIQHAQEKYAPPKDDPVVRAIEDFRARFGVRTLLVAGLVFDDSLSVEDLRIIRRLEEELRAMPRVARVFGLSDVRRVVWGLYRPHVIPVFSGDDINEADLVRLRRLVDSTPVYQRGLVSEDWRTAGLVVELERKEGVGREARDARLALQIDSVLQAQSNGHFEVYLTGMPLLNQAFQESTRSDVARFGWLSLLFVATFLLVVFRHWRPLVLASLMAVLALVWTLGLLAATDTPMSASLAMVVPLILVISVAFSVHYLAHYYGEHRHPDPQEKFEAMMQVVFPPSILTGLTTAVGFLSLATSTLESIQETGFFLAAGVLLSMLGASILLPALLSLPHIGSSVDIQIARLPIRAAHLMAGFVCRRTGLILSVAAFLILLATLGALQLRFDANPLLYFSPETPLRRSSEIVDGRLGGSVPLEILVERPHDQLEGLIPAVLRVEQQLRDLPEIGFVGSAIDFLQLAEVSRPRTAPPLYHPVTGRFPPDLWERLAKGQPFRGYVVRDSTTLVLRIACRVGISDSEALRHLVVRVERVLAEALPDAETSVTGLAPLLLRTQEHMVSSQMSSFGLAFVIILLLVFPFVRSWRIGLLAGTANLMPLVLILGVMGWLRIPMDIASIMIASVALGIIVDDTIHFLYHYRSCRVSGLTARKAIEKTYAIVGTPLIVTSLVFIGGFLVFTPSTFQPTSTFGLLSATTIAAAFVTDLLLLPALLLVFHKDP